MKCALITFFGLSALVSALLFIPTSQATDFTLSEAGILALDNNVSSIGPYIYNASILSNRDIPGTGVVFTIHFPSTNFPDNFFYWTSNSSQGAGTLAGLNVSTYSNFVLHCT